MSNSLIPHVRTTHAQLLSYHSKLASNNVRLAAMNALYNSLEFIEKNFDREGERNFIMQVVCEATQCELVDVQVTSFECLVKVMSLYYDNMALYMQKALFGVRLFSCSFSFHPFLPTKGDTLEKILITSVLIAHDFGYEA